MNISTYEARIAALEAQLGPSDEGGILSITITPDVGNSNAKLAAMMPIATVPYDPVAERLVFSNSGFSLDPETEYVITATPGSEYYCSIDNDTGTEYVDSANPGDPVSMTFTGKDHIEGSVYASKIAPGGSDTPDVWSIINLYIGRFQ